jgi:hypothetical protein
VASASRQLTYAPGVSSRLATGTHGEVVVVQTTEEIGAARGTVWLVLGNAVASIEPKIGWLGASTARYATIEEQAVAVDTLGRLKHGPRLGGKPAKLQTTPGPHQHTV